jgi:superfamily II DNA or RNA helicase
MTATRNTSLAAMVGGCSSWREVSSQFEYLSEKQKGDFFEAFTKAFLILDPEYATKLKHVWLLGEVPHSIAKKLKLPSTDKGIDLVAETKEGEFWAIQCKYRQDTAKSLTFSEISTFSSLAFVICRGFSFGLICSTTERFTGVLKDQDRIGLCAYDVWESLDADFFRRLRLYLAGKPQSLNPATPRPHQLRAIADGIEHFANAKASRGKLIMPCGSGKSLTAYFLARELGSKRILIAVPSLSLINQTLKVWLRESLANGHEVDWICVCSDDSAGSIGKEELAILPQDLGIPCFTDSDKISAWLKKKPKGLQVVFTTYQSGETLSAAARKSGFCFDLGIMDEAHKTVGDGDKLFSHLLRDSNVKIRRRVFMTATERRYEGKSDSILSMEKSEIYGDTFHLLSFKKAIEFQPPILSDYKIISIVVSRNEVAQLIQKNVFVKPDRGPWNKEIEADMLASLIALRKAMRDYPIRHAVSFHSTIGRAKIFRDHNDTFTRINKGLGDLATFHVSGGTPTGTRSKIISEFSRSDRALITNARCLTEGVDVPDIDCVLFADPRRSAVDIVQAVGRALRPSEGKKHGYVIIPILHDDTGADDESLESETFKEILTTLRALAANDERIVEYFRAISQERQAQARGGIVEFDIDEKIAKRINLQRFIQEIELKCWDRLAKLSWRPFEEARAFVHSLELKNTNEWDQFRKGQLPEKGILPPDIPTNPSRTYATSGWKSLGDWLGTGSIAARFLVYRPFEEARDFAHSLRLKNLDEWKLFCRGQFPEKGTLPSDIPSNPQQTYKEKGWKSIGDWLGTGSIASYKRVFKPFEEARAFVHSLNLKNQDEWRKFCKGQLPEKGTLPVDIPFKPSRTYAASGWKGLGDWLGTGTIAKFLRVYRPFEEARAFVHTLNLKNQDEWRKFCKGQLPEKGTLPVDIPAAPQHTFKENGWKGYGHWLGTGAISPSLRVYRPFEEARAFVHTLKLKNQDEWQQFCKGQLPEKGMLPADIPAYPNQTYKEKGWKSIGDWLGTGSIACYKRVFKPFEEARLYVHALKLKNQHEWFLFCKGQLPEKGTLPVDIPFKPSRTYSESGWQGYGDWLGTGAIAPRFRVYRPFEEARAFVHTLKLKNHDEWKKFCKGQLPEKGILPADIPAAPQQTYNEKGWKGYGDWLGTGTIATYNKVYRPFEKARAFVQSLGLKNVKEWQKFCKGQLPEKGTLPDDIPANPRGTYLQRGWKGIGDWLGTGTIATFNKAFITFEEAREFVHSLKLKSVTEWKKFCRGQLPEKGTLPADIPSCPQKTYKKRGWRGYGDWIGTGTIAPRLRAYRPFEEARAFVHSLKLKSQDEWRQFCKSQLPEKGTLPADIPANPRGTYLKKGWKGMGDWLGTGAVAPNLRVYRSFEGARAFVHSLKIKSQSEWFRFCKGQLPEKGTLPVDIPYKPCRTYAESGWQGYGDWLGTGTIAPRLRVYRPFEEARAFVHTLNLKNQHDWRKFSKGQLPEKGTLPADIPVAPEKSYNTKGWKGYGNWLGTGAIASRFQQHRSFEEARAFVQSLKLKNQHDWFKFSKGQLPEKGTLPADIPAAPHQTYKVKGWKGYGDWLGTGVIATRFRDYRPFEEARGFVHSLKLKSQDEWQQFCKGQLPEKGTLPPDIPAAASRIYATKGWRGLVDWLGCK